ncbi:MAG: cyanophycin synthetase, partial [Chthoniobacteraceae bacterium]
IRVDGEMMPEDAVAAGLALIRARIHNWEPSPTFFEITTALALWWFQARDVEAIVLETGLGGRLDATNIVTPSVVVISTIALDHEKYLGATIEEIAREKAGIIKHGVPIISLPQEPSVQTILEDAARANEAPLTFVTEPWTESSIGLPGSHQRWNAAASILAVKNVMELQSDHGRALRDVEWPGRFQRVSGGFVLDGGHNPAAAARLAETWREESGDARATLVLGAMRDKDLRGICAALLPIAARVFTVAVQNARAASAAELGELVRELDTSIDCREFATVADALEATSEYTEQKLVAGSLFLVGEAMVALGLVESDEGASVQ